MSRYRLSGSRISLWVHAMRSRELTEFRDAILLHQLADEGVAFGNVTEKLVIRRQHLPSPDARAGVPWEPLQNQNNQHASVKSSP